MTTQTDPAGHPGRSSRPQASAGSARRDHELAAALDAARAPPPARRRPRPGTPGRRGTPGWRRSSARSEASTAVSSPPRSTAAAVLPGLDAVGVGRAAAGHGRRARAGQAPGAVVDREPRRAARRTRELVADQRAGPVIARRVDLGAGVLDRARDPGARPVGRIDDVDREGRALAAGRRRGGAVEVDGARRRRLVVPPPLPRPSSPEIAEPDSCPAGQPASAIRQRRRR